MTRLAETRATIARDFGVPLNQIASWFHNRRTRQRARQLKEDFDVMKRRLDLAYLENQQLRHEVGFVLGLLALRWVIGFHCRHVCVGFVVSRSPLDSKPFRNEGCPGVICE